MLMTMQINVWTILTLSHLHHNNATHALMYRSCWFGCSYKPIITVLHDVYRTIKQTHISSPTHHRKRVIITHCGQNAYLAATNEILYTENNFVSKNGYRSTLLIPHIYAVPQKTPISQSDLSFCSISMGDYIITICYRPSGDRKYERNELLVKRAELG